LEQPHSIRAVGKPRFIVIKNQRIGSLRPASAVTVMGSELPGGIFERRCDITATAALQGQHSYLLSKRVRSDLNSPVIDPETTLGREQPVNLGGSGLGNRVAKNSELD
jgi:hypothetical protein